MQILDSLIEGPLKLRNEREANELIGMIVRYIMTGKEPEARTDTQDAILASIWPVMEKSKKRHDSGSKGGSKTASKTGSKPTSKTGSKPDNKAETKQGNKRSSEEEEEEERGIRTLEPRKPSVSEVLSGKPDRAPEKTDPFIEQKREVVTYLNAQTGQHYRATSSKTNSLLNARFREGFTVQDFQTVIDSKAKDWLADDQMARYLRPETLFGNKFEGYLQAANRQNTAGRGVNGYVGDFSEYD